MFATSLQRLCNASVANALQIFATPLQRARCKDVLWTWLALRALRQEAQLALEAMQSTTLGPKERLAFLGAWLKVGSRLALGAEHVHYTPFPTEVGRGNLSLDHSCGRSHPRPSLGHLRTSLAQGQWKGPIPKARLPVD